MKTITFYTNFLLRSTKLACLLACAALCCVSSAQEIDFQDKVAKPYIIAYNNRKYQFCPVDLNILKCEKFADICESFFQFHIFFSAWPDIKTPSRESFIICFDDIAFFSNSSIFMIEDLVIYVDRKTSKIYKRDPKNIIKYQCNRQEVSLIEKMRKLDSPDDVVAGWGRYSNFGPSNMQRTEDKKFVIWDFGGSSSRVTETLFGQKSKIN